MTDDDFCALCRREATGFAWINGARYCHGDFDQPPTCYEKAQCLRCYGQGCEQCSR